MSHRDRIPEAWDLRNSATVFETYNEIFRAGNICLNFSNRIH